METESVHDQAKRLFPNWSDAQRQRWVTAKLAAPGIKPLYKNCAKQATK